MLKRGRYIIMRKLAKKFIAVMLSSMIVVTTPITTPLGNNTCTLNAANNKTSTTLSTESVPVNLDDGVNKVSNNTKDNEYAYSNSTVDYNGKPYTFWQLQIPDQIKFTYEISNASQLFSFQKNVDDMRKAQDSIPTDWILVALGVVLAIVAFTPIGMVATVFVGAAAIFVGGTGISNLIRHFSVIKTCRNNIVTDFNNITIISRP